MYHSTVRVTTAYGCMPTRASTAAAVVLSRDREADRDKLTRTGRMHEIRRGDGWARWMQVQGSDLWMAAPP